MNNPSDHAANLMRSTVTTYPIATGALVVVLVLVVLVLMYKLAKSGDESSTFTPTHSPGRARRYGGSDAFSNAGGLFPDQTCPSGTEPVYRTKSNGEKVVVSCRSKQAYQADDCDNVWTEDALGEAMVLESATGFVYKK